MAEEYEFDSLQEHEVFFCTAPTQTSGLIKLLAQEYKSPFPPTERRSGRETDCLYSLTVKANISSSMVSKRNFSLLVGF